MDLKTKDSVIYAHYTQATGMCDTIINEIFFLQKFKVKFCISDSFHTLVIKSWPRRKLKRYIFSEIIKELSFSTNSDF